MNYYTMNEFIKTVHTSRSTVNRFYKKYKALKKERQKDGRNMLIPENHIKYFSLDMMIEHEHNLRKKIYQMQNLLDCIRRGDDMQNFLWEMEWDLYGTISYKDLMSSLSCYDRMTKLHEQLKVLVGEAEVRLFFTTESYGNRNGHHNHFVCYCSNKSLLPIIQTAIQNTFKRNQVDLQPYDRDNTGVFYVTKHGIQGADWDFLL